MQSLSSLTPIVDNIFDKYNNKNLVPIRSLSDHDILPSKWHHVLIDVPFLLQRTKNLVSASKWHHVLIDVPFLLQRTKMSLGAKYKYKG